MSGHVKPGLLVAAYLAAIVVANLLVTADPRWAVPNAFVLIGLDLVCRDQLDDLWTRHRPLKMVALIAAGAALSYLVNADTAKIALASCVAFGAALSADWAVYATMRDRPWLERANWSNLPGAAIDSVVFPLLAFPGPLDWVLVASLFAAKVGGGAIWALLLQPRADRLARDAP